MALTYIAISTITASGSISSIDFTNIPQTYTDLLILASVRSTHTDTNDDWYMRINNISNAGTYTNIGLYGNGSSALSWNFTGGTTGAQIYGGWNNPSSPSQIFTPISWYFPNYTNTSLNKTFGWDGAQEFNATTARRYIGGGIYAQTTAISRITIFSWNASWAQNTQATLYGIKNTV